jgi:hypothetical protein
VQKLSVDCALLEALNKIRHELSKARENAIHARLLQLILHWIVTFFQDFDLFIGNVWA